MGGIRPAAVAGAFYPDDAATLDSEVASYLRAGRTAAGARTPKAIIAPHAGYVYSGPIAGSAYALVAPLRGTVKRVVLAGPAHRVYVHGAAVPSADAFSSPLGRIPVDREAVGRICRLPFVEVSDPAHALEHSLEVHLPFLQASLGSFSLVPVVVGDASPQQVAELLELVWGGDETLVVVSSDLSHYLDYDSARQCDGRTAQAILSMERAIDTDEACGAHPINGLLAVARRRGMSAELLDLRNSGDTAGSRDRVVGYASFVFHEAPRA